MNQAVAADSTARPSPAGEKLPEKFPINRRALIGSAFAASVVVPIAVASGSTGSGADPAIAAVRRARAVDAACPGDGPGEAQWMVASDRARDVAARTLATTHGGVIAQLRFADDLGAAGCGLPILLCAIRSLECMA